MANVKVIFEMATVFQEGVWISGKAYYEATVNGVCTGKSSEFKADDQPGNILPEDQFAMTLDVADDASTAVDVSFKAWNDEYVRDKFLGEVRQTVSAGEKQSFSSIADTGAFILFWRVEPEDVLGGPVPGPVSVCRQHKGSSTYSTLAAEKVEIGVLVRGCWGESDEPPILAQHADMTLPTSAGNHRTLIGFFAEPSATTLRGNTSLGRIKPELNEYQGIVYKNAVFMAKRPHYYDANIARAHKICSLFCRLEVLASQAKLIIDKWTEWESTPPNFVLLGQNCSNRAAIALNAGNVISHISGLDTPYNLYRTLKKVYGSRLQCEAGYAGFQGGEYKIVYAPAPGDKPTTDTNASSIDVLQ
jgi:hypothetical protein